MNENDAMQRDFSDTEEISSLDNLLLQKKKPSEELDVDDMFELDDDRHKQKLTGKAIPAQHDELMCTKCFLVKHKSQVVKKNDGYICLDCE